MISELCAGFAVFVVADVAYTMDHYFVHHDRERYKRTHGRHHRRYNGSKDAPQLDAYELTTYSSAAVMSLLITSTVSMMSGNPGFVIGALLKYAHSLLFHLYQHKWWSQMPIRRQNLGAPKRGWGIASARYHAYHHSHPDDAVFTYAESWKGFDRILELAHPWLHRFTKDGARARKLVTS